MHIIVVNFMFYSILVDMLPTLPPPTESPVTTSSQSMPPTTTEASTAAALPTPNSGTTAPPPPVISVDSIATFGPRIAGDIYRLVCSVSVTGSTDQPTITWLDPMNNQIMSTTGSMSTLTFNPLAASDAGTYTCRATLGSATGMKSRIITVQSKP